MLELQGHTHAIDAVCRLDFIAEDGFPIALEDLSKDAFIAALFVHSAQLYPLAPKYLQAQLRELLGNARHSHLNTLARCCVLLSQQSHSGQDIRSVLARLARHPHFKHAAECIAQALLNQQYLHTRRARIASLKGSDRLTDMQSWRLPFARQDDIKPVPATLMRALLKWPYNDKLFPQALKILQQQPALTNLLCRHATTYTPQGKQLELKPSLLLLGPQRSRELVLLAHFESNLSKPVFPLRAILLKRRALIQQSLQQLAQTFSVALPCRAELIAYLLIYDAWRNPRWTTAYKLSDRTQQPWVVSSWLDGKPATTEHRVALRLCQYWRLPDQLSLALQRQHPDAKVNALIALSVSSAFVLSAQANIHSTNADNHLPRLLGGWLSNLIPTDSTVDAWGRYLQALNQAALKSNYSSLLDWVMRP